MCRKQARNTIVLAVVEQVHSSTTGKLARVEKPSSEHPHKQGIETSAVPHLDGILAAATQHAVFQDVGDALAVLHGRAQHGAEGLVGVIVGHGDQLCTCGAAGVFFFMPAGRCNLKYASTTI